MRPGSFVKFDDKVFEPPYAPHYDAYKDSIFEIVSTHHTGTHLRLKCVSCPDIEVAGLVHPDEVVEIQP
jgi:hypothetical protein